MSSCSFPCSDTGNTTFQTWYPISVSAQVMMEDGEEAAPAATKGHEMGSLTGWQALANEVGATQGSACVWSCMVIVDASLSSGIFILLAVFLCSAESCKRDTLAGALVLSHAAFDPCMFAACLRLSLAVVLSIVTSWVDSRKHSVGCVPGDARVGHQPG